MGPIGRVTVTKRPSDERRVVKGEVLDAESDRNEIELRTLEWLADWLDTKFQIPGLPVRFGLDALLGLLPGLGDTVTGVMSVYLLQAAIRRGVSRAIVARMAVNILVDYVIGSLPLLGDAFDIYWKSNARNAHLLRQALDRPASERGRARWTDWLIVAGLAVVMIGSVMLGLRILYRILAWLWG